MIIVGEMNKPDLYTDKTGQTQVSMELTAEMIKFSPFGRSDKPEGQQMGGASNAPQEPMMGGGSFDSPQPALQGASFGGAAPQMDSAPEDDLPF